MSGRSPWWVDGGTEACAFCGGRYAYEVERRCSACDRPGCPWCVVTVRKGREIRCPECSAGPVSGSPGAGAAEGGR